MSNPLPQTAVRRAFRNRLDDSLDIPILVQWQAEDDSHSPLVMIEPPESVPRGDLKQDTGHELDVRVRVHTRYPKGRADVSQREAVAGDVHSALEGITISGHHLLHLPEPQVTPQSYELGGRQAYDLLLDYSLLTQTL
jgi:hypothetical protein